MIFVPSILTLTHNVFFCGITRRWAKSFPKKFELCNMFEAKTIVAQGNMNQKIKLGNREVQIIKSIGFED